MGMSFLDIMEIVGPIGVAMIPGVGIPAAIAMSAAMKGGSTALKGGDIGDILLNTGLGAATGAAGVGIGGALSKGLGGAATKTTEKAMDVGLDAILAEGLTETGMPIVTDAALKTGTDAMTKIAPKVARLDKLADVTSGALGEDPEKTKALLGKVKSVGKMAGAGQDVKEMLMPEPPRFSQVVGPQQPGMDPRYQFGTDPSKYRTAVVGGGYY